MGSGVGLALVAKRIQEENRNLLKKKSAFGDLTNNRFIHAPDLNYQSSKADYQILRIIKNQKTRSAKRQALFIKLGVFLIIISIFLSSWMLT